MSFPHYFESFDYAQMLRDFPVGDAFTAGWLHGLCAHANWSLGQRLRFASACGALVCQGAGAIDPQPDELAVLAFLTANAASG